MEMRRWFRIFLLLLLGFWSTSSFAKTVVFWQAGFPAVDSPAPDEAGLRAAFADASFVDAAGLGDVLSKPETDLLVLPYGSAWPEADWDAILRYLDHGGNLIVLGGKPFTRAAYEDASGWHLRAASVAQSLELFITSTRKRRDPMGWPVHAERGCVSAACPRLDGNGRSVPVVRLRWLMATRPVAHRRRGYGSDHAGLGRTRGAQAGGAGNRTGPQCESFCWRAMDSGGVRAGCGFLQQQRTAGEAGGNGGAKERPLRISAAAAAVSCRARRWSFGSSLPIRWWSSRRRSTARSRDLGRRRRAL